MQTTRTESTPDPGGQTPLEELFLLRLRYREGRLVELGANKPFQLDDPETAWVVYAGKVDIFVVSLHNGEVVGPRRHLLRAEAGQAFFSIGRMDAEGGIGLLAVGVGGTRVLRVKRERLQEFAANPAHRQEVVALLDVWVNALGRIAASTLPPKDCELLDPETEVTFGPNVSACARRDVVWIRCTEGTATFLGREDLPAMDGETRLPLSKQTFIRTLSITKLDTIGTEAYASQDTAWQALDQFHALVLTCIRLQAHERERAEQVRLESKAEADRRGVQRTLSELVSILQPRQERPFD
ncbi:MAG: hypothetical protein ACR2PL_14355, partial [Dehalococcoidia bacterium]